MRESSIALRLAAQKGSAECVRLLLPGSDPKADESYALRIAAKYGHVECLRLLLPVSDAKAEKWAALRWAAQSGHAECVRMLLAVSGPLGEIDGLLEEVFEAGQAKMAALLIEQEPMLLDGVDVSKCLVGAQEKSHGDLAAYLSSIIDQSELSGIAPDRSASSRWVTRL